MTRRIWLCVLGYTRWLWWSVIRSEAAQRWRIDQAELLWCGKRLSPAELDDIITGLRPRWRRK